MTGCPDCGVVHSHVIPCDWLHGDPNKSKAE